MPAFLRQIVVAVLTAATIVSLVLGVVWMKSHPMSMDGLTPVAGLVSMGALAYGARKKG